MTIHEDLGMHVVELNGIDCVVDPLARQRRRERWPEAMRALTEERDRVGFVSNRSVQHWADFVGVSTRQVRARLQQTQSPPSGDVRAKWVATEAHMALAETLKVAHAYRYLRENDDVPLVKRGDEMVPISEATFRRGLQAYSRLRYRAITKGEKWLGERAPYAGKDATHRNDIWTIDNTLLPVRVSDDDTVVRPYGQFIADEANNLIPAMSMMLHVPTGLDARATLLASIAPRRVLVDGVWELVGGMPGLVHSDNGPDFQSWVFTLALVEEIPRRFSHPHTPQHNAILERRIGAWKDMYLREVCGWIPKQDKDKNRTLPRYDKDRLLTFAQFQAIASDMLRRHNEVDGLEKNDGRTPLRAWLDDPHPVQWADMAALASLMTFSRAATVRRSGVKAYGADDPWMHPALYGMDGELVDVRAIDDKDPQFVDVLQGGRFLCRIWSRGVRTEEEKLALLEIGRTTRVILRGHQRETAEVRADITAQRLAAIASRPIVDDVADEIDALEGLEDDTDLYELHPVEQPVDLNAVPADGAVVEDPDETDDPADVDGEPRDDDVEEVAPLRPNRSRRTRAGQRVVDLIRSAAPASGSSRHAFDVDDVDVDDLWRSAGR